MYSLIIKNAKLIDGTGKKAEVADVAVEGDVIVDIAPHLDVKSRTTLDAQGLVLAPGFVDIQNHSDSYWQLFDNPGFDSLITQGFTSILIGHCGSSLAPLLSHDALLSVRKWHDLSGTNINWTSFGEYAEELSRKSYACNIGSLVGYSTLRRGLLGDQIRPLEKRELEVLKNTLKDSLSEGAFGLSSGLSYAHEIIISELELFELVKTVAGEEGLFSVHLRNEGSEVLESLEEAIDLAAHTDVNIKISHFKIRGSNNWHKLNECLERLEIAYHKGVKVHFDVYPYDSIWQPLYSYLPKWAIEGGRSVLLKHLENPLQRKKILDALSESSSKLSELIIASTNNSLSMTGRSLSNIAKTRGLTSEEIVLDIIKNSGSEVLVFDRALDYNQVQELYTHPLSFVASDGSGFASEAGKSSAFQNKLVHPRCFGTTAKFLREAQTNGKLSLEEAVQKLTSLPARKVGFKKRGEIKVGFYADMVLFDPDVVSDRATLENPYQRSVGIEYVFVNGKTVVSEGLPTGQLSGYFLRKN